MAVLFGVCKVLHANQSHVRLGLIRVCRAILAIAWLEIATTDHSVSAGTSKRGDGPRTTLCSTKLVPAAAATAAAVASSGGMVSS